MRRHLDPLHARFHFGGVNRVFLFARLSEHELVCPFISCSCEMLLSLMVRFHRPEFQQTNNLLAVVQQLNILIEV